MFESVTGEDDILENTPKKKKLFPLQNGALQMGLKLMLSKVEKKTKLLGMKFTLCFQNISFFYFVKKSISCETLTDVQRRASLIQRNFVYPGCMLLLFALTGIAVLIVVQNTLELLIGIKALPLSTRVSIKFFI